MRGISTFMTFREIVRSIGGPDQARLIHPPSWRMLAQLARYWLWMHIVVFLSFGFLLLVSFPLLVCFLYYYYLFSRRWTSYGYSGKLAHGSMIAVWGVSVLCAAPLRSVAGRLLETLFA